MTIDLAADNDLLIKLSAYKLLKFLGNMTNSPHAVGMLGVARYVVKTHLDHGRGLKDPEAAAAHFDQFQDQVTILEPTTDEVALATAIEEAAIEAGVPLDTGESQLCAIAITREVRVVATGDKRAIRAAEAILDGVAVLALLTNRVACLEQLMSALVGQLGGNEVRRAVCAEPGADKAVTVCFECGRTVDPSGTYVPEGLQSYIDSLRVEAPRILIHEPLTDMISIP